MRKICKRIKIKLAKQQKDYTNRYCVGYRIKDILSCAF